MAAYYTLTAPPIFAIYYWTGFIYGISRIGPALDRIAHDPGAVLDYTVKGIAFLAFLAFPFAVSAAIGAACGWLYGRHVRPLVARLLPRVLPRADGPA